MQCPGDFFDFEDFKRVSNVEVFIAFQGNTAIEAGLDLLAGVFETTQGIDPAAPVNHMVAQQANLRVATHNAIQHHATGNIAHARQAVDLADLDHADDLFTFFRSQHAGHGIAHVVYRIVNDV